jgi:hypothetical protein
MRRLIRKASRMLLFMVAISCGPIIGATVVSWVRVARDQYGSGASYAAAAAIGLLILGSVAIRADD